MCLHFEFFFFTLKITVSQKNFLRKRIHVGFNKKRALTFRHSQFKTLRFKSRGFLSKTGLYF